MEVKPVPDLHSIDQKAGVPDALEGCHTSFIDGYVVIGHVPVDAIQQAPGGATEDCRHFHSGSRVCRLTCLACLGPDPAGRDL